MKTFKHLFLLIMVAIGIMLLLITIPQASYAQEQAQASTAYVTMYRLYNPNSGEHLYTKDSNEVSVLTKIGWKKEGEAWKAASSGQAVYRLYNPNNGDHHYTLDSNEYNTLGKIGWRKEGVAWYSDKSKGVAVYRLYNPSQTGAGSHHYTTDKNEYNVLKTKGWRQEGVAWYGVKVSSSSGSSGSTTTTTTKPTAKYSYELYTTSTTIYAGYKIPIFIKTDNPEQTITKGTANYSTLWLHCDEGLILFSKNDYDDVQYLDDGTEPMRKVEGGYLDVIGFKEPGTYTLSVTENSTGNYSERIENLAEVTVTVLDADKLKKEWQYSVIDKATTSDMDSFEKMDAICSYLLSEFKYYKKDSSFKTLDLITDSGLPYPILKEWDSAISPLVLCEIAEKVGGFDKIHNCYYDYTVGTDGWYDNHVYAELTIGNETRRFKACPYSRGNIITNITKVNLINSNLLRKL